MMACNKTHPYIFFSIYTMKSSHPLNWQYMKNRCKDGVTVLLCAIIPALPCILPYLHVACMVFGIAIPYKYLYKVSEGNSGRGGNTRRLQSIYSPCKNKGKLQPMHTIFSMTTIY